MGLLSSISNLAQKLAILNCVSYTAMYNAKIAISTIRENTNDLYENAQYTRKINMNIPIKSMVLYAFTQVIPLSSKNSGVIRKHRITTYTVSTKRLLPNVIIAGMDVWSFFFKGELCASFDTVVVNTSWYMYIPVSDK